MAGIALLIVAIYLAAHGHVLVGIALIVLVGWCSVPAKP